MYILVVINVYVYTCMYVYIYIYIYIFNINLYLTRFPPRSTRCSARTTSRMTTACSASTTLWSSSGSTLKRVVIIPVEFLRLLWSSAVHEIIHSGS